MKIFRPLASLLALGSAALAAEVPFYVGTYTKPGGCKGIYRYVLDLESGKVSGGTVVAEVKNPSFLAIHPTGRFLYAASEGAGGEASAFAIQPDGSLKFLNTQSAKGNGTCHIIVDPAGKNVLVANYSSGSVAVLPIQADGSLGVATGFDQHTGSSIDPARQKGPHAHSIYVEPTGKFAYSCDLGTDKIHGYKFDAAHGTITPNETATGSTHPGAGPRHLAIYAKTGQMYVINELNNSIEVFNRNPENGALTLFEESSTLPDGSPSGKNSAAEIFIHPNGKFLYASNRGDDSIAIFTIGDGGRAVPHAHTPAGVKNPRTFAIDPTGQWLLTAGQDSGNIAVFKIDTATGDLTPADQRIELAAPVCIMFMPR